MEINYRNNVIEFAMIYLEKNFVWGEKGPEEFDATGFTYFIFKELFDVDINSSGYGLDDSTRQMTNNIGDLKIYNEDDYNKEKYLMDINPGDLVFFHEQSLNDNQPAPENKYPGHVGIYLGDNKFIHASSIKEKIVIDNLDNKWLKILVASRDIIKGLL